MERRCFVGKDYGLAGAGQSAYALGAVEINVGYLTLFYVKTCDMVLYFVEYAGLCFICVTSAVTLYVERGGSVNAT